MRCPAQNHPRGAHTQPPPGSRGDTRPRRCLSHAHARSALRTCWRWRPCSTTSRRTPGTRRRCSAPDRASPGPARGGPRQAGDGGARAHRRSAAAVRGRAQRKWCTRTLAALRSGRAICVGGAAWVRKRGVRARAQKRPKALHWRARTPHPAPTRKPQGSCRAQSGPVAACECHPPPTKPLACVAEAQRSRRGPGRRPLREYIVGVTLCQYCRWQTLLHSSAAAGGAPARKPAAMATMAARILQVHQA